MEEVRDLPAAAPTWGKSSTKFKLSAQIQYCTNRSIFIAPADPSSTISLPGTSYSVTYFKRANSPQLLAKNIPHRDDLQTPIALSDFLSRAWRVANDKARELGWIV
jgi:hypothetical protein